jgi:ferric-dicitrate binding protein FerR (iron transport regulator)
MPLLFVSISPARAFYSLKSTYMQNHRFDELITAKLAGTLDESGQQELQVLLQQHPEWEQDMALLERYWKEPSGRKAPEAAVFDRMMEQAADVTVGLRPVADTRVKRLRQWKWVAAAVVVLAVAGTWQWWLPVFSGKQPVYVVQTKNAERRYFLLPDGSKVHLNASSQLHSRFNATSREIWLQGEAYFEVAKDVARPFIVHAATMNIRALGTAFNVKAYSGDEQYETTLLEGAVEVYLDKAPDRRLRLRPYEKLCVERPGAYVSPEKKLVIKPVISKAVQMKVDAGPVVDSTLQETAWISNRLQFDSLSFVQLAQLLERWYGVQITFRNEAVKKYVFSGSFATETVTQALNALQLTEEFHFSQTGTQILIY